jgi:ABC-type multidrug transport system fused ATPase/permease subunit
MNKLNIHNLLIAFIKSNVVLFGLYFLFTLIQYPLHYIYTPEYYGKVINAFKDKNQNKFIYFIKILVGLYVVELILSGLVMTTLYFIIPNFTEYATGSIFEFIIDHYENDFENIPIGEILSKTIRMPNILFDYIDIIKNEFLKYIFVFISGFIHYYSVSKYSFFAYGGFIILNYVYIYVMYTLFNKYELKSNSLQDKMYELLIDCLNNLVSIYSFNQEEYEKKRFYTTSFINYKENMYKTKELYLKGDVVWSTVNVSIFVILNFLLYKAYKNKEIDAEKLISTFIITFSIIKIFDNSERCAYNISRVHSQIKDSESFFNTISKYSVNPNKKSISRFKNGDIVIKDVYHNILDKDGLSIEHFSKCDVNYRSKGTYRHIVQFPKSFEYSISYYDDPNEEINITELTKMRHNTEMDNYPKEKLNGKRAVTLKFTLLPGIYATMLLREITKESTETEYLMKLTSDENSKQKRELNNEQSVESSTKKLRK